MLEIRTFADPEAAIERDTAVYQRSFACGKGFQLVKRLSDEPRKVAVVGVLDPSVERDSEDSDRDLGREVRGWTSETALSSRVGERRGP